MIRVSDRGVSLIKEYEGFSAKPYVCSGGKRTIGYGHTGRGAQELGASITEPAALILLRIDIQKVEIELNSLIRPPMRQGQVDALISLAFNIGCEALRRSTLLRKLNDNPDDPTLADEFRRWHFSNGVSLKGLKRRREAEIALFLSR
ncbi:MAG: lysozyme [Bacteroidales bacterium]